MTVRAYIVALWEGLRFLLVDARQKRRLLPSREYLHWRLGTVYRTFDENGHPRSLRELFRDAWRDLPNVIRHLLWRRKMRRGWR